MHLTSLQCYLTINLFASSPPISIKRRLMPSLSTMIFFLTKLTLYLSSAFLMESCRGSGFGLLFRQLAIFVFPTPTSPRSSNDISAEEEWCRELSVPIWFYSSDYAKMLFLRGFTLSYLFLTPPLDVFLLIAQQLFPIDSNVPIIKFVLILNNLKWLKYRSSSN